MANSNGIPSDILEQAILAFQAPAEDTVGDQELRKENDYLLGKFIGKSRDLQSEAIDLPQTVDELQFHCLTLNEKLILATLAKEQLEEAMMQQNSNISS